MIIICKANTDIDTDMRHTDMRHTDMRGMEASTG